MRIVVTGGDGFIGTNLRVRLKERGLTDVVSVTRDTDAEALRHAVNSADFIYHLAGVNRPDDPREFETGNAAFTRELCDLAAAAGRSATIAFSSSIQAERDNAYGASKRTAEQHLEQHAAQTGATTYVLRLPNVFGKWCRPNYNSAVATFCHNVARGIPITVNDPSAPLRLMYIDDVIDLLGALLPIQGAAVAEPAIAPVFETTVGEVAAMISAFPASRATLLMPPVGAGLARALHATYLSYLEPAQFTYALKRHEDPRGVFVEMLKTPACGQFSFFTAGPGITRGEHYHHSKTEKFLVIAGEAHFGFRHIVTGEAFEVTVRGDESRVVETAPGWAHNVTNIGKDQLIVMLWANEIFDPARPDTVASPVAA